MANVLGRIREARRVLMFEAARRWKEREPQRREGLARIAAMGVGAADSPARQRDWTQREAAKANLGRTVRFVERVLGSNDLSPYAPSVQASAVAAPVARICTLPQKGYDAEGIATGLLIPGGLLLTNYHVFPQAAYTKGHAANFKHARDEHGINDGIYFEIDADRFFFSDSELDFAIVAIHPKGLVGESIATLGSTRLIEATGKVLTGLPMNIIQHPGGGPRNFAVSNNRLVDILPTGYLQYETDTEKGSSGSPVYNTDWELVALHHSGVPEMRDGKIYTRGGAVWNEAHGSDSDIHWVANEGIRVSFIVERLKNVHMGSAAQQAILAHLLSSTADPAAPGLAASVNLAAESAANAAVSGKAQMAANLFSFSGPVTVHVYAPPAASGPVAEAVAPASATAPVPVSMTDSAMFAEEKALVFDENYAERPGYDADFLSVHIPLPSVAMQRCHEIYSVGDYEAYLAENRNAPQVDTTGSLKDDAMVLRYHHYSLAHNKQYRMCMWTASNYDYREVMRGDTRKRKDLGGENWRADPRVPVKFQLMDKDIYVPAKRIDRGHVVRREDNCWGEPGLQTDYGNSDTYHWTNCTPQHEAFNQENPNDHSRLGVYDGTGVRGIWGRFESQIVTLIKEGGGQAVLFAGPVLADFFEPRNWGQGAVRIPTKFWKVVVIPASPGRHPKLLSYGFIFEQKTVAERFDWSYESLVLPEFEKQQVPIARIADMTGIVFASEVLAADQAP